MWSRDGAELTTLHSEGHRINAVDTTGEPSNYVAFTIETGETQIFWPFEAEAQGTFTGLVLFVGLFVCLFVCLLILMLFGVCVVCCLLLFVVDNVKFTNMHKSHVSHLTLSPTYSHSGTVSGGAFVNNMIMTSSTDGSVRRWTASSTQSDSSPQHAAGVASLVLVDCNTPAQGAQPHLVSGDEAGNLVLWRLDAGTGCASKVAAAQTEVGDVFVKINLLVKKRLNISHFSSFQQPFPVYLTLPSVAKNKVISAANDVVTFWVSYGRECL